jgi:hypothetical protein
LEFLEGEAPVKRFSMRAFVLVFACLAGLSICRADELAAVTGLVTDPNGRSVPGVTVIITNLATNVVSRTVSNDQGIYRVPSLQPGIYRMTLDKDGFKSIVKSGVELHVQDVASINFELQIGSVNETVTVEAGGLVMNTTDASVSTVIDRKFVENLPLNGRSFQDLISMTPGVVTQSPQALTSPGYNGDFSVNGQRTETNYYTVDGVTANISAGGGNGYPNPPTSGSISATTALGTTQSLISVDALQEFRIQGSTYSAEYGRSPGGQFSLVTRSGTNAVHGSAFDYLRNNFFDANDWFNNHFGKPISPLRQNDFGGTLGGPILAPGLYNGRDKTFFFVSYEGLRLTQPQAATIQYVPDTYMRQQAPASLQPMLNAFPLQNGTDSGTATAPSLAQFIEPYSLPSRVDSTSIRLDHSFGAKLSLFFRFGDTPSSTSARDLSAVSQITMNTQTYTLGATSQLSGKADNEFRLGYARVDSSQGRTVDAFGGARPINLASAMGAGSYASPEAAFYLILPGFGVNVITTSNSSNKERQWNMIDTFSYSVGHHQLKVGVDYRRIESPTTPTSPIVSGLFFSTKSVLNNSPLLVIDKLVSFTAIFNETAAFAQDQWSVAPGLSVSLGLRWEIDPPLTEAHGNDPYTLLGSISNPSSLMLAPQGTSLWKTSWYNFAPRLGVAWQAHNHPGWNTIVRAGGGAFFDTDNEVATSGFEGIGFLALRFLPSAPLPLTPAQLNFSPSATPPYTSAPVFAFPGHLQLPYTLGWSASVEQAMGRSQALTISYVGSNGRRLIHEQQFSLQALNPNFNSVTYITNGVTSNYQAAQIQFQRTVSRGLAALSSYTWSHCLDFGSNSVALRVTRGNCDFDVRHNFQGGVSWDLPGVTGNKLGEALLNHWGIDGRLIARTGFPVTLQGNFLTDPATGGQYYGNVNLTPNQPIYLYGSQYPGGRAVNPAAFSLPANPNDPGNAPRNFVRGFGAVQINMTIRREFPISEKLKLQFRAEAFNLLNHPNFGYVNPSLTDSTFGQATQMLNQSLGTVAHQYQQGGPRSVQFALKLIF